MLSRYYEDISMEDVARFVGISRKYLCRIFGQFLQLTPSQYLLQVRLDAACDLLRNSHICISDVARSVGYSDCLVFSRMFRTPPGSLPHPVPEKGPEPQPFFRRLKGQSLRRPRPLHAAGQIAVSLAVRLPSAFASASARG